MFWDNKKDSEDMQRLKNSMFLEAPVTNKQRDEVFRSPATFLILLGAAIVGFIVYLLQ